MVVFLGLLLALVFPWYYVHYDYKIEGRGEYQSEAYIHVWYKYEYVSCDFESDLECVGQPGSLITSEGISSWGFDGDHFAMKILFLISWSFVVISLIISIYLIIRNRATKMMSYFTFIFTLISAVIFCFLNDVFTPCSFEGINLTQNGPCDSFSSFVQLNEWSSIEWGPYGGWWCVVISSIFSAICLFFAIVIKDA